MKRFTITIPLLLWACVSLQANDADSLFQVLSTAKDTSRILTLRNLAWNYKFTDSDTALYFGHLAEQEAESLDYTRGKILCYGALGVIYYGKANYPEALTYMKKTIPYLEQLNDSTGLSKTLNNLGSVYARIGGWQEAAEYYTRALRIKEKIGATPQSISMTYNNLGGVYNEIGNNESAIDYYKRAIDISQQNKDTSGLARAYGNLARLYRQIKRYQDSRHYFTLSEQMELKGSDFKNISNMYSSIGILYAEQLKYDSALYYYHKAVDVAQKGGIMYEMLQANMDMSETYLAMNKPSMANKLAHKVLKGLDSIASDELRKDTYLVLAQSAEDLSLQNDALDYYKRYTSLKDSLLNKENARAINEIKWRYETEKKDLRISQLAAEAHAKTLKARLAYWIAALGGLGILVLLYAIFLKNKLYKNKEARLKAEKEMQQYELDMKHQELSSLSMHIMLKNEALNQLKDKLSKKDQESSVTDAMKLINDHLKIEKDWDSFKLHFEKVHQGFFDRLHQQYPSLTPNEHKLCAYLKLNFTTKQISQMLSVSVAAVDKSRNRLRKKLSITPQDNLVSFVQEI